MMPSIELRLATMRRALQEVILPAIAADNALAREQAQLVAAHLDLIAQQLADAPRIDAKIMQGTAELGSALAERVTGGPRTQAAAQALRAQVEAPFDGAASVRRAHLAAAIDALLTGLGQDGDERSRHAAHDLIIEHALVIGLYERVCFASNGLDPERADLPPLAALLAPTRGHP